MKMIVSALLLVMLSACSSPASQQLGDLHVSNLWAKATPPNASVAGGYLSIDNRGSTADRLLRIESAAAKRVEIHEMSDTDGVARMREVLDGVPLPANAITELKPGGYHLMFIEPTQPFVEGQKVQAMLVFEKAGSMPVTFDVRALTTSDSSEHGHH